MTWIWENHENNCFYMFSAISGRRGFHINDQRWRMSQSLWWNFSFHPEFVTDGDVLVWCELLARHVSLSVREFLEDLRAQDKTGLLFWLWAIHAWNELANFHVWASVFNNFDTHSQEIYPSINIYIKDLWDPRLPGYLELILGNARGRDRKRIRIEILEDRYWEITPQLFHNIIALKKKWHLFVVDDYDLMDDQPWNISRSLFHVLWNQWACHRIKLDHIIWRRLIEWDGTCIARLRELQIQYPWICITAEWIQEDCEEGILKRLWINFFQHFSWWNSRFWYLKPL